MIAFNDEMYKLFLLKTFKDLLLQACKQGPKETRGIKWRFVESLRLYYSRVPLFRVANTAPVSSQSCGIHVRAWSCTVWAQSRLAFEPPVSEDMLSIARYALNIFLKYMALVLVFNKSTKI